VKTFDEYQEAALSTFTMPAKGVSKREQIYYTTLKLNGEAGEVAEKIGKIIRDQDGEFTDYDKIEIMKEIGDVLWYCAVLAHILGFTFSAAAWMNIQKLIDRKNRGVLHGSGDNR
jgi:NTP pyrophosphatase (non-canonical NTP hydrolase)